MTCFPTSRAPAEVHRWCRTGLRCRRTRAAIAVRCTLRPTKVVATGWAVATGAAVTGSRLAGCSAGRPQGCVVPSWIARLKLLHSKSTMLTPPLPLRRRGSTRLTISTSHLGLATGFVINSRVIFMICFRRVIATPSVCAWTRGRTTASRQMKLFHIPSYEPRVVGDT